MRVSRPKNPSKHAFEAHADESDHAVLPHVLTKEQRLAFRDALREARSAAAKDAERYGDVFHVLERIGLVVKGPAIGIGQYAKVLYDLSKTSPYADLLPVRFADYHAAFDVLLDRARVNRNNKVHGGAAARNLMRQCVEIALIMEDAFRSDFMLIRDFMVRDPVAASMWEPISFIRQKMLLNSFSYLPLFNAVEASWGLVSDRELALFLFGTPADGQVVRRTRLATTLEIAIKEHGLTVEPACVYPPTASVEQVLPRMKEAPVLVVGVNAPPDLLGIVTAFDLL